MERKTLNTVAYEHLRGMIYGSDLEFGRIYSETRLAAQLNISRTPMRDALNRLSQERYIDILPNRGFMLHSPTQADILENFHVRMMIEGYCAGIVARDFPGARARSAVGRMEDALDRQRRLMADDGAYSLYRFWMDDLSFHRSTLEYMGISSLLQQYERVMYTFMPHHLIRQPCNDQRQRAVLDRHRASIVEHARIIEGIRSCDTARVQSAIRAHIDSGLLALYASQKDLGKTEDSTHEQAD